MPVPLSAVINPDDLYQAVADGLVRVQTSPDGRMRIFTYTQAAQYGNVWTPATRISRGLIVDDNDNIVARPFGKFFNYGDENVGPIGNQRFVVSDKMDGSLAIAYRDFGGHVTIATKGSFTSEQAVAASKMLSERWGDFEPEEDVTYLFEYIAPENRIVVDYGDRRDLVLLAIIDNATGSDRELPGRWEGPVVVSHDGIDSVDAIATMMQTEEVSGLEREGYVLRFEGDGSSPNLRVKVKYPDYVQLHRIITGTNARSIWELVVSDALIDLDHELRARALGTSKERAEELAASDWRTAVSGLPDELYAWADELAEQYMTQYDEKLAELTRIAERGAMYETRKDKAMFFKDKHADIGVLITLSEGSGATPAVRRSIWRSLRPEAGGLTPFSETNYSR